MLKNLILVLILLKFGFITGQNLNFIDAICSINGTQASYFLDRTVVAKFQSPNFPASLVNNSFQLECLASFQTVDTDYCIWFALYNGYSNFISITDGLPSDEGSSFDSYHELLTYTTEGQTLLFQQQLDNNNYKHWNAFEGIVATFNPSKSSCPFDSDDIEFINLPPNMVIPLTSSYSLVLESDDTDTGEPTTCKWAFDTFGSSEYNSYLKLVIRALKINENVIFELFQGDQRMQRFENNITIKEDPQVFYFYVGNSSNSKFQLFWNDTNTNLFSKTYFFAYISIVTFPLEFSYYPCNSTTNADTTIISWKNYNPNQGCKYNFIVPENTEYYLTTLTDLGSEDGFETYTENFDLERNVDILSLSSSTIKTIIDRNTDLRILPDSGFMPREHVFSFFADGSVQQGGFQLTLQKLDCRCLTSKIIIYDAQEFELSPVLCNEQSCPITISANSSNLAPYFVLIVKAILRDELDYTQWTNSNGDSEKLTTESFQYAEYISRWFMKDDVVVLEYNFGIDRDNNIQPYFSIQWYLTANGGYTGYNNTVDLNVDSTYYFLDTFNIGLYSMVTICTSENDTLELFLPSTYKYFGFQNLVVYDSDNLNNFMGSIASLANTHKLSIPSQSGCLTLLDTMDAGFIAELFFRSKTTQSKNCTSTDNVFVITQPNRYFEAESTLDGPCEIIFLNKMPGLVIDGITTTSQDKIIFKSALNQKVFMEISPNETSLYNGTILYTAALSIVLPLSSKISITLSTWSSRQIQTYDGQKGVMASPAFSGLDIILFYDFIDSSLYELVASPGDQKMVVTFKVIVLHGNQKLSINNGTAFPLIENQVITVEGASILVYSPIIDNQNYTQDYFLMEYNVSYVGSPQTTLSLETTTSAIDSTVITSPSVSTTSDMNPTTTEIVENTTAFSTPFVTSFSSTTSPSATTTFANVTSDIFSTYMSEIMTSPTMITSTNAAEVTPGFLSYKSLLLTLFTIMLK